MKRILVAAVVATFALGSAAMAQDASCETKAVGKDGKALAGAAKTSFMKKCMAESCATKAVSALSPWPADGLSRHWARTAKRRRPA